MFIRTNNEWISKFDGTIDNENNINYYTNAPFAKADPKIALTFIKSTNVQAYPCGRRRSTNLATSGSPEKRLPFDPEARLNTEANNRKHSGLNGYTQTYLKEWEAEKGSIDISLAGYLFSIKPYILNNENIIVNNRDYRTAEQFATGVISGLDISETSSITRIYANIVIEDVHLFSAPNIESYTGVLRKQDGISDSSTNEELDLLYDDTADKTSFDNYYFSGLSFSTTPLVKDTATRKEEKITVYRENTNIHIQQTLVSLCILEKVADSWQVHEPARLPDIKHGVDENSVEVNKLIAKEIKVPYGQPTDNNTNITSDGVFTPFIDVELLDAKNINIAGGICIPDPNDNSKTFTSVNTDIRTAGTIEAASIESPQITATTALYQKRGTETGTETMQVPIIELVEQDEFIRGSTTEHFWQLQLSRIGKKLDN